MCQMFEAIWKGISAVLINSIPTLVGVIVGFWLAIVGEDKKENKRQKNIRAEFMRAVWQEIGANRFKCQTISMNRDTPAYLESLCWDRVRMTDTLYHCITSKEAEMYGKLINLYMGIARINLLIGANLTALEGMLRGNAATGKVMIDETYDILREAVINFLPTLTDMEATYRDFLIKEGFFTPPTARKK